MIQEVTFGQNMAEKKKFMNIEDVKKEGVEVTFTEEEIIQYVRPDSVSIVFPTYKGLDAG